MPRVVPSQVVAVIDQMFQWAAQQAGTGQATQLGHRHLPQVLTLVELARQVPSELVTLSPNQYLHFVAATSVLAAAVQAWQGGNQQHHVSTIPGISNLHPVTLVRQAMTSCPDENPALGTMDLRFLADADLRASIRLDISAANANLRNGEWKGGTVLAGSAVEALLLWAIYEFERVHPGAPAAAAAARVAAGKLSRQPDPRPERWTLHEYIEVAEELQLIKPETAAQTRQAKDFRNLIHPGRAIRLGQKCDRATALAAVAAVEFVVRDLTP